MPEPTGPKVTVVSRSKRVRCSSIYLSRLCDRFPWLSIHHPESFDVTRLGNAVDKQVSVVLSCIATGDMDNLPSDEELMVETAKILDWLEANYPIEQWEWHVQERLELGDPETGEILTAGTPDLMCLHRTEPRFVDIDWKKAGQMWAGHMQKPDVNDQQLAYVAAFWLEVSKTRKIESAKIVLAAWDESGVRPLESQPIAEQRLTEVIEAVRAIPPVDQGAPQPEASVGEHCLHCWQRLHCDVHLLPGAIAIQAGLPAPFQEFVGGPLTPETTIKALSWLEAAEAIHGKIGAIIKLVRGNADAGVIQHGPVQIGELLYGPQPTKGKRSGATIKTLEAEGLQRLIREGKDGTKCKWYPAPKP